MFREIIKILSIAINYFMKLLFGIIFMISVFVFYIISYFAGNKVGKFINRLRGKNDNN